MRLDEEGNKKKLSKRDMGANMEDYARMGYAPECVREYILTLLNSNFEEWHMQNADKSCDDFPFNIKKMSSSGCLFDFDKLNNISKNVISKMSAEQVYASVTEWAKEFDPEFYEILAANKEKAIAILAIGRGGKKPRKDLTVWSDVKGYAGFFFDELFKIEDRYPENFDKETVKTVLSDYLAVYTTRDDQNEWFNDIKAVAEKNGFASDMKAYKADPSQFKGSVADVSMFIRVALTGKLNSPDMFAVTGILGEEKVKERISAMIASL
jgi:glutamyl-tRNA synthetase